MLSAIEHFEKHKIINPKHVLTTIDNIAKATVDDPSLLEYKNLLATAYGIEKIDAISISSAILAFYEKPSLKIKNEINEQLNILLKKLPYSKEKYTLSQAIDLFKEEKKRHIEKKKEQIKNALKNNVLGSIATFEFSMILAKTENRNIDLNAVKKTIKNSLKCYEQKITEKDLIAFEAQLLSTLRVDEAFKNASRSLNISTSTLCSSNLSASSSLNDIGDMSARNSLISDETRSRDSFVESGDSSPSPRNYLSDNSSPRDSLLSESESPSQSPRNPSLNNSNTTLPRSNLVFLTTKTKLSRKKSNITIGAKQISPSSAPAAIHSIQRELSFTSTTAQNTDPITNEKVCDELANCIDRLSMMETSTSTSSQTHQAFSDSAPEIKPRKSLTTSF